MIEFFFILFYHFFFMFNSIGIYSSIFSCFLQTLIVQGFL